MKRYEGMPDSIKSPIPDILEPPIPDVKEFLRSHTGGGGKDRRGFGGGGSGGQDRRGSGGGCKRDRRGSGGDHPDKGGKKESEKGKGTASSVIRRENLELHFGSKREDVAKIFDISVSTFKRVCRDHGIPRWPNRASNSVCKPPDPHGEMIPSPTFNMLSSGGRITTENKMGGQNPEPNECLPDSFEDRNFSNTGNGSIAEFEKTPTSLNSFPSHCCDVDFCFPTVYSETEAIGGSSKWASQLKGQTMQSTTYPNCNDFGFPQSQIASTEVRNESMGSLEDRRDLLASLVAPQKEPFSEGHVFGSDNSTGVSCSYIAPSQSMQTFPHSIESLENWEYMSAFSEGHLTEEDLSGSINTMVTIPCTMPLLTERQDTRSVSLKAIYGAFTIKFELPLTSGINELKEEVSKTLECELGSFRVEYKDEVGEWILMARDENVKEYLQLVTSLGNQVTKLKVHDKVPNATNFCGNFECDNCRYIIGAEKTIIIYGCRIILYG